MAKETDASLSEYSASSIPAEAESVEGIIDYLSWHQRPPCLYFYDWPAAHSGVPLAHFVGEQVELTLEEIEVCTGCGEAAPSSPCGECGREPPFANCVTQPAQDCTYNTCPFETFKNRNCSEQFAVYLAVSDRVKVGISRAKRLQTRWREQGATHAICIALVPNRFEAGLVEAAISEAREEMTAVLETRMLSQSRQTWTTPLSAPVETLTDAVVLAGDYFPQGAQEWYQFPDRDRSRIENAVRRIRGLSTGGKDDEFPHSLLGSLSHLLEGESVTSRFIGVRGQLLVTEDGFVNCNTHGGHRIRIKTTAPHTEYITDVESPPSAVSSETDWSRVHSSERPTRPDESADKANASDFM